MCRKYLLVSFLKLKLVPNFKDPARVINRIVNNLLYYQTNYFLVVLILFAAVGIMHPVQMLFRLAAVTTAFTILFTCRTIKRKFKRQTPWSQHLHHPARRLPVHHVPVQFCSHIPLQNRTPNVICLHTCGTSHAQFEKQGGQQDRIRWPEENPNGTFSWSVWNGTGSPFISNLFLSLTLF